MTKSSLPLLAILACALSDSVQDHGSTVTFRDVSCAACSIHEDSVAQVGGAEDGVYLELLPAVDSRGYFYSAGAGRATQVIVFDPGGAIVGGFGTPGPGPGLVSTPIAIHVDANDSVFVSDRESRIHTFSPNHQHVREVKVGLKEFTMPRGPYLVTNEGDLPRSVRLANGTTVLSIRGHKFATLSREGIADPIVYMDTSGMPRCYWCGYRSLLASGDPDRVYTSIDDHNIIEEITLSGEVLRRFVREADWFPIKAANDRSDTAALVDLSRSRLIGLRRTSDGLIWTHTMVMKRDAPLTMATLRPFEEFANGNGFVPDDIAEQIQSHFGTRVEVFDPAKNELLASKEFSYLLFPMTGDFAARPTRRGSRLSEWTVFKLRLERN